MMRYQRREHAKAVTGGRKAERDEVIKKRHAREWRLVESPAEAMT
jgi:hypothetical protein